MQEKFVSECYVLRVETSFPVACEKAAVETMYHLQHSASGRRLATLGAAQREIFEGSFGDGSWRGSLVLRPPLRRHSPIVVFEVEAICAMMQ
jgi:hypothetical protein